MNWTFFHKLSSPKWFLCHQWALVAMAGDSDSGHDGNRPDLGLLYTPPDYLQGNSYRIIFLHVPASFLASVVYVAMAMAGAMTLIWRIKLADMALKSMAPIGASFCFLSLVTGAIWGKPTWEPGGYGCPPDLHVDSVVFIPWYQLPCVARFVAPAPRPGPAPS